MQSKNKIAIIMTWFKIDFIKQAMACICVFSVSQRLRQEKDHQFKVSLGYTANSKPVWAKS
jgi:hypothetical protein